MGLNISLSCIDCNSRLNTIEDVENSWKMQSKELNFQDESFDFQDEFTVFRSQAKDLSIDEISNFFQNIPKTSQSQVSDSVVTSPESRVRYSSVRPSSLTLTTKQQEDQSSCEIFTPTTIRKQNRYKAYSRNYSEISNNIVETVRKING